MEKALGIRVVRHITKKPAGDAVDLERHFRCCPLSCHWFPSCAQGLVCLIDMQADMLYSLLLTVVGNVAVYDAAARPKNWS